MSNASDGSPFGQGLWSGLPMPWTASEDLDREAFRALVEEHGHSGCRGIYVAGTSGEFHAMDLEQFRAVVETFAEAMRGQSAVGAQVGCGAFSLRQVCRRIEIALASGFADIQLPLPGWAKLSDEEVLAFFGAVARRYPQVRIVVYDNPAAGRTLGAELWPRLLEAVPAVLGAKLVEIDTKLVGEIRAVRPDFQVFATERNFLRMWEQDVRSMTAWITYSFPHLIVPLWRALEAGEEAAARPLLERLEKLHAIKERFRPRGYRHGIIDRLMGLGSGALPPVFARVLAPWRSVDPADVAELREALRSELGENMLFRRPAAASL